MGKDRYEVAVADSPAARISAAAGLTATGTAQILAVDGLGLATGLLIAALLTRSLGPELYALYSVAAAILMWAKSSTNSMFSRATIKWVAKATDRSSEASALLQSQLVFSLGIGALFLLAAPTPASWLRSPQLVPLLRLFALDIPLWALAGAHLWILADRDAFRQAALPTALYWLTRLLLVVLFMRLGLSIEGAIAAHIGASLAAMILARAFARPPLWRRFGLPDRRLWQCAMPLFFTGTAMRLLSQLDLAVVRALDLNPEGAGYYGAAQNMTIVPLTMFAAASAPALLATSTQQLRDGQREAAREIVRQSMRWMLWLLPLAGIAAGASSDITRLAYGNAYSPSA